MTTVRQQPEASNGVCRDLVNAFNRHVGNIILFLAIVASLQLLLLEFKETREAMSYFTMTEKKSDEDSKGDEGNDKKESSSLCTRDQIRKGQWTRVTLKEPPYVPSDEYRKRSACFEPEHFEGSWNTWEWRPLEKSCTFSPWDKRSFCDIANSIKVKNRPNAKLAIVGDSLSWEHYSSMVQLLGLESAEAHQLQSRRYNRNHVQTACNWTMIYRRSDLLQHVLMVLQEDEPQVLVLNRGTHYVYDPQFEKELVETIAVLQKWQKGCVERKETCWLFVRTTVPGHPHCQSYTEPSNSTAEMEALVANMSNYEEGKPQHFHWWDFKHQNELMLNALVKSGLAYQVIDAYDINILRPDQHKKNGDCLHSCYPGKMDVYNQIMLHFLKQNLISPPTPNLAAMAVPLVEENDNTEQQGLEKMNCGCPKTCDDAALSKWLNNLPYSCGDRVEFLISRYGTPEKEACEHAHTTTGACGPECNPKLCNA